MSIQDFKLREFDRHGIVMGGAVAAIVKSFLDNIISPMIASIGGVPDMSQMKHPIGGMIETKNEAGEVVKEQAYIMYGNFIQNTIDFVILALLIFIALKVASRMMKQAEEEAPPSDEVVLLTEIRDALAKR